MKAERLEVNMKHNGNSSHETRISLLEQSIENVSETLVRMERKFDLTDSRFDIMSIDNKRFQEETLNRFERMNEKMEKGFSFLNEKMNKEFKEINEKLDKRSDNLNNKIDQGFNSINSRMWTNFFWMLGGFAGILSLVAHFFKWI